MNFDPLEILYLTEEDWGDTVPDAPTPQEKGIAIDSAIKRKFGGVGAKFDPFDMKFKVDACVYHEVKSTTTKWLKVSPTEIEHAEYALEQGDDTLYWAIEQLEARDEYHLFAVAKYSKLRPFFFRSTYDLCWVKRGETWMQEPGYLISKYVLAEYAEV